MQYCVVPPTPCLRYEELKGMVFTVDFMVLEQTEQVSGKTLHH